MEADILSQVGISVSEKLQTCSPSCQSLAPLSDFAVIATEISKSQIFPGNQTLSS